MPNVVTITGLSGTSPYDIYICDVSNTLCLFITGLTISPPTYSFNVPYPLNTTGSLLIKIIDGNGCERFEYYTCISPTPTTTPLPSPTPLPCNCINASAVTIFGGTLDFVDCNGNINTLVPVGYETPISFCASSTSNLNNVSILVESPCISNLCP